jgi:phosphoserine phosphatase
MGLLNQLLRREFATGIAAAVIALLLSQLPAFSADPLPSWTPGPSKDAIQRFVERVTTPGTADFVPAAERIATFDNDGTLWAEQPVYFQAFFIFDRVHALSPKHPEWQTQEPYASILRKDFKAALAGGEHALLEMVMATHAGMTTDEFSELTRRWISTARHPATGRLLTDMTYQPMLELLAFLRSREFKTFIVSGGGIEFIRPWSEATYGIPPEQVIGSSIRTRFEMREGRATLVKLPELNFIDDKAGKPVAIQHHIGRRPILACGNSDGDLEMLQWTAASPRPHLCLLVHHDDAAREYAYDRRSSVGRLDKGLDEAMAQKWSVISMKTDWTTVYRGTPARTE